MHDKALWEDNKKDVAVYVVSVCQMGRLRFSAKTAFYMHVCL